MISLPGSLVAGTTPGPLTATLQAVTLGSSAAPVPMDLAGAVIVLKVLDPAQTPHMLPATIASAASGQVTVAFPSGLLMIPGTYRAMFLVTTADGQIVASPAFQWAATAQPF